MQNQNIEKLEDIIKISIEDLNDHLICILCKGYFREAHTIPECMHTFCKICLFNEFSKRTNLEGFCPCCQLSLGPAPHSKVIYDRNIQSFVDKIFPNFAIDDNNSEAIFNEKYKNPRNHLDN